MDQTHSEHFIDYELASGVLSTTFSTGFQRASTLMLCVRGHIIAQVISL